MTRDPFSVAMGERAAAIAARAEKRLAELERRRQPVHETAAFINAANRMTDLRPVRIGLTVALKRGKKAYITVLNGVPIAFTEKGWYTQEMVEKLDAERPSRAETDWRVGRRGRRRDEWSRASSRQVARRPRT